VLRCRLMTTHTHTLPPSTQYARRAWFSTLKSFPFHKRNPPFRNVEHRVPTTVFPVCHFGDLDFDVVVGTGCQSETLHSKPTRVTPLDGRRVNGRYWFWAVAYVSPHLNQLELEGDGAGLASHWDVDSIFEQVGEIVDRLPADNTACRTMR
jgi:hypothetical protein